MANVQNKENMTISIREYTDNKGNQKKVWKTIGELITWDDGSKSFELWGPTGSTKGNVFAKDDNQNQQQAPQQQRQAPQPQPQQQQRQAPQQQPQYQQRQAPQQQQQQAPMNEQQANDQWSEDIPY